MGETVALCCPFWTRLSGHPWGVGRQREHLTTVTPCSQGLEMYLRGRELQSPFILDEDQARLLQPQDC